MTDEIFRPAFIRDVYAGGKEEQIAADKEKDEENAANGYDEMGNVIAPEIPPEWMWSIGVFSYQFFPFFRADFISPV